MEDIFAIVEEVLECSEESDIPQIYDFLERKIIVEVQLLYPALN